MEGWPWRRREGHGRRWGERKTGRTFWLVMRGWDKGEEEGERERDEGRSTVIRRVGERLDPTEHGERDSRGIREC